MFIPNCYYNRQLLSLIDSLINDGYSYSNLSEADNDRLVSQCIDCLGDDSHLCMNESENVTFLLKKYILSCNQMDANNLARDLRKSALHYFSPVLEALFEDRIEKQKSIINMEHGLFQTVDRITGEVNWLKSA